MAAELLRAAMARVLPASAGAGAAAQEVRVSLVGGSRLAARVRLWSSLCEGQVPLSVRLQPLQQQKCGGRDLVSISFESQHCGHLGCSGNGRR